VEEQDCNLTTEPNFNNPNFYHEPGPEWDGQYPENTAKLLTKAYIAEPQEVSSINYNRCGNTFPSGNALHAYIPSYEAPKAKFYYLDPIMPVIKSTTKLNTDILGLNF
jgi:hypothetical protein